MIAFKKNLPSHICKMASPQSNEWVTFISRMFNRIEKCDPLE